MDDGWWYKKIDNNIVKKEGINYELWRIWWSICTRGIETKIK